MDKKAILQTLYKLADNTWKDIVKCEQVLTRAQTTLDIQTQLCADAQALLAQSTNADERNVLVFNLAMHIQDKYNTNTFINQTKTAIADMEQDINNLKASNKPRHNPQSVNVKQKR